MDASVFTVVGPRVVVTTDGPVIVTVVGASVVEITDVGTGVAVTVKGAIVVVTTDGLTVAEAVEVVCVPGRASVFEVSVVISGVVFITGQGTVAHHHRSKWWSPLLLEW